MEELLELRACLEQHRYADALNLVAEMEEMSREDKINKIGSFIKIMLLHLIKRHAEKRSTRSWDLSIDNALHEIQKTNQRRKARGCYVSHDEVKQLISENYPYALRYAAFEAFGGRYEATELEGMFVPDVVQQEAYQLLVEQGAV
jgi:hypothetical protein